MGYAQYPPDQRGYAEFRPAFEGSYQYMDLNPEGYKDRNAVNGSFYKLTFAPTLKAGKIGDFFSRPELRLFATDGLEQQTG